MYFHCTAVDCGDLSSPSNGLVQFALTTLGAIAVYTCDSGYMIEEGPSRTCEANGNWSGNTPTCECKTVLRMFDISCLSSSFLLCVDLSFHSSISHLIHPFLPSLPPSFPFPLFLPLSPLFFSLSCSTVVDCGFPSTVFEASLSIQQTTFGSTVSYACFTGYTLVGNEQRTCQANGEWTEGPVCESESCHVLCVPVYLL